MILVRQACSGVLQRCAADWSHTHTNTECARWWRIKHRWMRVDDGHWTWRDGNVCDACVYARRVCVTQFDGRNNIGIFSAPCGYFIFNCIGTILPGADLTVRQCVSVPAGLQCAHHYYIRCEAGRVRAPISLSLNNFRFGFIYSNIPKYM